jgi:phosphoribosylaminoimidazole-succinocarboxamide synthase
MKVIKNKIYDGSCKALYQTEDESSLILYFKDDFMDDEKQSINVPGKGVINNILSSFIMQKLDIVGIDNHLIDLINMREQSIQLLDMYPIQLIISSVSCGRYISQFGIEEGYVFDKPILDFRVKNRELRYPIINESQILSFGWMRYDEFKEMKRHAFRVYDFIAGLFAGVNIRLVQTKLEFGRFIEEDVNIILGDEISLDNCKLWDMSTNKKFGYESDDKDAIEAYSAVTKRFNLQI